MLREGSLSLEPCDDDDDDDDVVDDDDDCSVDDVADDEDVGEEGMTMILIFDFRTAEASCTETIPTMSSQDMQRPPRLRALFLTLQAGTLPSRRDVKGQVAQNHQSPPRA